MYGGRVSQVLSYIAAVVLIILVGMFIYYVQVDSRVSTTGKVVDKHESPRFNGTDHWLIIEAASGTKYAESMKMDEFVNYDIGDLVSFDLVYYKGDKDTPVIDKLTCLSSGANDE